MGDAFVDARQPDDLLTSVPTLLSPVEEKSMAGEREEGREDFESFGELLRYLRETYGERTGRSRPGGPRVTLTALSLIDCLKHHGYPITSGAYSLLESGKSLPKDPIRFFEAIWTCLAVEQDSKYRHLVKQQYGFDLMARYMGREEAEKAVPHGSAGLRSLGQEETGRVD